MLVASSRRVLLPLRASVRSARGYRVENKVGQNFPFGYDGTSRARFAAAYWGLLVGVGFFGVPGLAWWLQTGKFKGTL